MHERYIESSSRLYRKQKLIETQTNTILIAYAIANVPK